jgi:hypothetical protein
MRLVAVCFLETQSQQEIACFSYDDRHEYHCDGRSLRYYYPPRLGADLCQGFDSFRQLDDSPDDHLDSLLKTLIHWEQEQGAKCQADIITWRGMMTKVNDGDAPCAWRGSVDGAADHGHAI